jgi:hypothetical protein
VADAFQIKRKPRGKPFKKGNKIGHRFQPGESGNPGGRPPSDISPTRILEELARIAFLDPRKLFDANGDLIPIDKLDEDTARAINGIDHDAITTAGATVGRTTKLKILQKTQALELLGRYHKLFTDRVEQSGPNGGPIEHEICFGDGQEPRREK